MAKKDDPTVKTTSTTDEGARRAPANSEADDYAGNRKYEENPDKPGPDSVAQVEVLPE